MSKKDYIIGIMIAAALAGYMNKDYLIKELPAKIFGNHSYKEETLRIVLNTPTPDLSEYGINLTTMIRTANMYEGLVAFDRNLKIVPALALSWGNIDPTTWEFKLRREVKFHDESPFTAQSVADSFIEAKKKGGSQMETVLSNIKEIKVIDDFTLQVITKEQDPLILSKLTKFFITKKNYVGTGPYRFNGWEKGIRLALTVFENYWGRLPMYRNVEYVNELDKEQRQNNFNRGNIDILVAVPKEQALELPKEQIKTSYSLEVNFLMFKLDDPILTDRATREAIRTIFNPLKIEDIGNNFVRQVSQFVAPGVFGYNPNIPAFKFDEEKRVKNLFGNQRKVIGLDFLSTYRTLAEYLTKQLADAGFLVESNAIEPDELLDKIKNNKSQLFVIGWQADNGDAGDFLDAFIHSQGEFNKGRYVNLVVDKLIEKSRKDMNPVTRLQTLQKIMELVDKDLIGIPLFESSRIYALKKGITWEPRLDGLVLASEVK